MIGNTSFLVVFLVGIVVLIGIIIATEFSKRYRSGDENPSPEIKFGEKIWNAAKHPAFFIAIGVAMINWLVWALSHDFWNSLWASQSTFWALNVSGWIAPSLILIKDEEGKKTHPIAKTFAKIIGALALVILLVGIGKYADLPQKLPSWSAGSSASASTSSPTQYEILVTAPPKGEKNEWSKEVAIPKGFSIASRSAGHLIRNDKGETVSFDPKNPACVEGDPGANPCMKTYSTWVKYQATGEKPVEVKIRFFPFRPVPQ